ncbi:MAG: serine hydrolase [Haliea sp.]|jgi:CubicO group peptidase (beta-lactamase class C family)|nr:serine hydrolase [Haliea sp.]
MAYPGKFFSVVLLSLTLFLVSCSDGSDNRRDMVEPDPPMPDFAAADAWLEAFVAAHENYPGGSMIVVDKTQGVIHKSAFGNQDEETVALVASLSKMPAVTLLMALHEDDANVEFDIQAPINSYLPWVGVWDSDITTEHLLSHRSGLPGEGYPLYTPIEDYLPHICQALPEGTLLACAETIFITPLPNLISLPADIFARYGGSQWQLSGGVAETVGGANWQHLWDQYIATPCELEQSRFGNNYSIATDWDGNTDSLVGLENPWIGGGMATTLDDYAKLLSLHLNGGACGDHQVLSPESVAFMKEQRTPAGKVGGSWPYWGYGMGWWVVPPEEGEDIYLYLNGGLYGSSAWIDVERQYGGVVIFEDYSGNAPDPGVTSVVWELIPIIEDAIDAVR